jgi:competence protein ComEC
MFSLAAFFAIGILSTKVVGISLVVTAWVCLFFAFISLLLRRKPSAAWLIAIAFGAAGALSYQAQLDAVKPNRLKVLYDNVTLVSGTPVEVEGDLAGRPEPSYEGAFFILRSDRLRYRGQEISVSGNARIFVPESQDPDLRSEISNLKYGSRVRITCALEREDEYLDPGVQTRREILDRQDIDATASIKSGLLVEHLADESVFLPLAWVYDQRASLIDDFERGLSQPAAGVMIASLLGDKYFLDKETSDLFREGGTFHILVISGLHITFIGGLLLLFLRRLTRNRWIQFVITTGTLWAYTLAVGADVPVVRAAVMFTIVLFAYAIYRRGTLLNSFGISALVLLVWRPQDLFNPSFQLTFVSVAAIVAIAYPLIEHLHAIGAWTPSADKPFPPNVPTWLRRFCETLYWRDVVWAVESKRQIWTARLIKSPFKRLGELSRRIASYLFDGIVVSLVVQVSMLPLSVVYFHRVAVSGVLLNLWVGFFIALESFAAVLGALISHVSLMLASPFFIIADAANWLMLSLPRVLSWADWSSFRLPAYVGAGRLFYVLFFVPLIFLAVMLARWRPFDLRRPSEMWTKRVLPTIAATIILLVGIIVSHPFSTPRPDGRVHIDFLDVGQGDSAFVTFPNGETWLIDGGGKVNYRSQDETDAFAPDTRGIGEAVVSEVLWYKGYSYIDHILATHADADHIQGLTDVAKNFGIGSAIFGRMPMDDPDFIALAEVLDRKGIPAEVVARGDRIDIGNVVVEVLYPQRAEDPNSISDNNHSVVLRIIYGSRSFLLTGDMERQAESDLLNNGGTITADLVKVAHHGSRTSSTAEFIAASHPQYAVISVGRHSPFGHPHPDVVEGWLASGAKVLTTGENGMISFSTSGKDLEITRFMPN